MIESVGYTPTGTIWMKFLMNIHGEQMTGIMEVTTDQVKLLIESLEKAIAGATQSQNQQHEAENVRNGKHYN